MDMGEEGGSSRECLIPTKQERTARLSHVCLVASRLVFLFSHGLLVLTASVCMSPGHEVSWWSIFLPVWIGDSICVCLVVASWFVSCPYIQLCLAERQPRLGIDNPSILTEILPEIVMAILGFILVMLAFLGEYLLCRWLVSAEEETGALVASVVLLMAVATLLICYSVCMKHNTAHFGILGCALFLTLFVCIATHDGPKKWRCLTIFPSIAAVLGVICAVGYRIRRVTSVLCREERLLYSLECLVLLGLLATLLSLAVEWSTAPWSFFPANSGEPVRSSSQVTVAKAEGMAAGLAMCLVAILRARMFCIEWRHGSIRERLIKITAVHIPEVARPGDFL